MVSVNKIVTYKKGKIYSKGKAQWKSCALLKTILIIFNLPHIYGKSFEKEQKIKTWILFSFLSWVFAIISSNSYNTLCKPPLEHFYHYNDLLQFLSLSIERMCLADEGCLNHLFKSNFSCWYTAHVSYNVCYTTQWWVENSVFYKMAIPVM